MTTKTQQHTAGPWAVHVDRKGKWEHTDVKELATQVSIATVYDLTGAETANARLIAAAPQLLEALQAIGNYRRDKETDPIEALALCIAIARIATAQATGGQE